MTRCSCFVSRYGSHLAVGVGSVRAEVLLGGPYLITSCQVLAFERSGHYVEAVAVTIAAVVVISCFLAPPRDRQFRLAEQWAARHAVDRATALECTYIYARRVVVRGVAGFIAGAAATSVVVGAIAGATGSRLVQYGFVGACLGFCTSLIGVHGFMEAAMRPGRAALAGDTAIGDALPRFARPLRGGRTWPCSRSLSASPRQAQ